MPSLAGASNSTVLAIGLSVLFAVYAIGYLQGRGKAGQSFRAAEGSSWVSLGQGERGSHGHVSDLQAQPMSHAADAQGNFIMKQVMVPKGAIPHVTGFSRAVFKPTQMVQRHAHEILHEVFYVESGNGTFILDDVPIPLRPGQWIHVPPGKDHAVLNGVSQDKLLDGGDKDAVENQDDLVLLYFGVLEE